MARRYDVERKTISATEKICELEGQITDLRRQLAERDKEIERLKEQHESDVINVAKLLGEDAIWAVKNDAVERELAVMRRAWELHDTDSAPNYRLKIAGHYIDRARAEVSPEQSEKESDHE